MEDQYVQYILGTPIYSRSEPTQQKNVNGISLTCQNAITKFLWGNEGNGGHGFREWDGWEEKEEWKWDKRMAG